MGKRLVITEKPSVARDIVAALGGFNEEDGYWENDDFYVTFAVGHLLELLSPEEVDEKFKRWTLDNLPILPERFSVKPKGKDAKSRLKLIGSLLEDEEVEGVINACDAGREGELIFREVVEYLASEKPIERLWLQSMTKKAILRGFEKLEPGTKYDGLSTAAHCRNYTDWLIGMNATRVLTRRLKTRSESAAWSAGRVQTPTLGMLVEREVEILEHNPIPFWRVRGSFDHGGNTYEGSWFDPDFKKDAEDSDKKEDRIFDEAKAKEIVERIAGKPVKARETRKPSRETAPPLFDLTSLQREANRRFGWSARRTLSAAQRCYEGHKLLTYPRTDSKCLPEEYTEVVDETLVALQGDPRFAPHAKRLQDNGRKNEKRTFDDSKISDHFAIIPTGELPATPLSGDDEKLYELVVRRFLATFHPPAIWSRVDRVSEVDGEHFRSRDKVLQEPGWREVIGDSAGEQGKLPNLIPGQDEADGVAVEGKEYEVLDDATKPPARINEAGMLTLMENAGKYVDDEKTAQVMKDSGIGTPATRADIIENLITKGYVMRAGRSLRPSVKGIRLIDILQRMKAERLASPALTGELERQLIEVEKGNVTEEAFMADVYDYAKEIVELTKTFEFDQLFPDESQLGDCPMCKKPVYERSWFYRCKEPPGVRASRSRKKKAKEEAGEDAPEIVDCPFRIWKDKSGRYIDRQTVRELVSEGKSRPLDGFITRGGRTFRGILEVKDGEINLERVEGGDEEGVAEVPEYEVDTTPLGPCPHCKEGEVKETRQTFICSKGLAVLERLERDTTSTIPVKKKDIPEDLEYCQFLFPRTVCKREMTREEAQAYMRDGKTEIISDFISRRGRPFSAFLFMKETGRHGFEFPPRGGGDGATKKKATKKKAKKKATKKKATKKKAAKKKTTAKKKTAAKKKTTAKKKTAAKKKTTAKKKTASKTADAESTPSTEESAD